MVSVRKGRLVVRVCQGTGWSVCERQGLVVRPSEPSDSPPLPHLPIRRLDGLAESVDHRVIVQHHLLRTTHTHFEVGEAARNKILNDAFAEDPEFFEFIRSMEAYADTFDDGSTTMVISPDSDFFEFFENSSGTQ